MWLRAIESDLRPLNIGPSCAWKKTTSREHGYAQEDYAMKREREKWRRLTRLLVVFKQHAAPSAGFAPDSSISSSRLSLVIKAS